MRKNLHEGGGAFVFSVWAGRGGGAFYVLLFGRGMCYFFLLGRGTGEHSLTGLPGLCLRGTTTKKNNQKDQTA